MAIKIQGTTVVDDSRELQNIASLDSATTTTIQTAIGGGGEFTLSGTCGTIYSSEAGNGATGTDNFFVGYCAGWANTTGTGNIFIGKFAGQCNTTGLNNTFLGRYAGRFNTTGVNNTFIGNFAGFNNTTGGCNIFFGSLAGFNNSTGSRNIFFGTSAGQCNTTGLNNTFFGAFSGNRNTTGGNNTFIGLCAGYCNTTGSYNNFIGNVAGQRNTTGCHNNFFGRCAGYFNTTGNNNTFIGCNAGYCNTTGSNNIFFGCSAGNADAGAQGLCTITTQSNYIIMGNGDHTNALIQISWTTVSDCRDKCIFGAVPHGRNFLQNITPVEYAFKDRKTGELKDTEGKRRYGFSAQDVLVAEGENPVIVDAGDPENLKLTSDHMIPVLVNAVKELSTEVDALNARLAALEN